MYKMDIFLWRQCGQKHFNEFSTEKNVFYKQRQEKMKQNWEDKKDMEKENNTDESDFSENAISNLNSL